MNGSRPNLLWLGETPSGQTTVACQARGIILSHCASLPTATEFSSASGIVFSIARGASKTTFGITYGNCLRRSLWHGLKAFILLDLADAREVGNYLNTLRYGREPRFLASQHEVTVPEEVARWDAGPAWSGTVEISADTQLTEEDEVLVRRAFGNCQSVKLVAESAGRSAKVFCAYARLADSRAGPFPLPFFAKLDRHPKIRRELANYRDFTTLFVPFNQRPNLDWNRCALGAERGILVGNFIEESETLREVVERGTARGAIHSLFGGALRGWRGQAYYDSGNTRIGSIARAFPNCLPSNMRQFQYASLAKNARDAKRFGATMAPRAVEALLLSLPEVRHRCATMHGDLHGENIRVHRSEAILIDFHSTVASGPLVGDPAALDVSLIMGTRLIHGDHWIAFVRKAYQLAMLCRLPPPADPFESGAPLWSSVRLVRQVGLGDQFSDCEYAIAVAVHLLRHASYRPDRHEEENRRAISYALAEALAVELRRSTSMPNVLSLGPQVAGE